MKISFLKIDIENAENKWYNVREGKFGGSSVKKIKIAFVLVVIVLTAFVCVSCVPSRDACKTKYENAGYKTIPLSALELELSGEDVDFIYCGTNEKTGDYIRIVCFKKKDKATEYTERMNVEYENGEYKVEQQSRVVLIGTQNAFDLYNNKGGVNNENS